MKTIRNDPTGGSQSPLPAAPPSDVNRYAKLGTSGVSISSSSQADVTVRSSRVEGWVVAGILLLASALAMGIYLVVLHH